MNPTTRRHPRTLNEAFGPYTSQHISEPTQPWTAKRFAGALSVVAAALALSTCAVQPAHAQFMSGNALYARLQGNDAEKVAAAFYIAGVFDAYKGSTHCAPSTVNLQQLVDFSTSVLANNPALRDRPADNLIGFAFMQAWPCPKRGGPST